MPKLSRNKSKTKPRAPRKRALVDYEVEVKLRCDELSRLTEAGLTLERSRARHFEDNWVFKLPDGKLRKGQYLRVRHTGNGDGAGRRHAGVLTYKGKSRRTNADAKGKYKGKKVTSLPAGRYRVRVSDKSDIHNFRLRGPGVNRAITGENFEGSKSRTFRFRQGTYRFYCEPHPDDMKGSFKVR